MSAINELRDLILITDNSSVMLEGLVRNTVGNYDAIFPPQLISIEHYPLREYLSLIQDVLCFLVHEIGHADSDTYRQGLMMAKCHNAPRWSCARRLYEGKTNNSWWTYCLSTRTRKRSMAKFQQGLLQTSNSQTSAFVQEELRVTTSDLNVLECSFPFQTFQLYFCFVLGDKRKLLSELLPTLPWTPDWYFLSFVPAIFVLQTQ